MQLGTDEWEESEQHVESGAYSHPESDRAGGFRVAFCSERPRRSHSFYVGNNDDVHALGSLGLT